MSLLTRRRVIAGAGLAGLAALVLAPAGAQPPRDESKKDASITTVDGVTLRGTYYKGTQGKDSPVALMLHEFGKDRTQGEWDKVAKALQAKGFAVLTFDFRGHGGSTSVEPNIFWSMPHNSADYIRNRGNGKKPTIRHQDFKHNYIPYLVNDIAAVRKYLEKKNDASECNISNLFVIGDQTGALLGMLWVATEWQRPGIAPLLGGAAPPPAGQDIAGCAWMSMPSYSGSGTKWNANHWPEFVPQLREKVPMCFFYGEKDKTSESAAKHYMDTVLRPSANSPRNTETFAYGVTGTSLKGIGLLGQSNLKGDEKLFIYVDKILQKRGGTAVWQQRGNIPEALVPIQRLGVGG